MSHQRITLINGEDYYAVPGQMEYLRKNQGCFHTIWLNINLDGVGYKEGRTVLSFFNLPESVKMQMDEILARYDGLVEGLPWVQGVWAAEKVSGALTFRLTESGWREKK